MKYIMTILYLFATSAKAHQDHALSNNMHEAYHIAFWSLCGLVAYKVYVWYKAKSNTKQK